MLGDISVVICVYTEKRWGTSVAAIKSTLEQDPSPESVVVVVDHNDALLTKMTEFAGNLSPKVTVLANARTRGLSGARNTALDGVATRYVAFLDDDAVPRPGWLAGLKSPFTEMTGVVAVGGRAEPVWPSSGPRPVMLPPELRWIVGCSFEGQFHGERPEQVRNVMGCSMAFDADALRSSDGFDEALGRVGKLPVGCEETEVCIRLGEEGSVIILTPRSVVDHHVSSDRLSWGYVVRRSWGEGVSKRAISDRVGRGRALSTERGYVVHVLPRGVWRCLKISRSDRHPAGAVAIVASLASAGLAYLAAGAGTTVSRRPRRAVAQSAEIDL